MSPIIADEIAPRLFMGPLPPPGSTVASAGFTTLVLCAQRSEYRRVYMLRETPVERAFQGVELVVVDLDDNFDRPLTRQEFVRAETSADIVKRTVREQKNALVTCMMGRNRSGLVTALALRSLCRWSGTQAMERVRRMRNDRHVLSNPQFEVLLEKLPAPAVGSSTVGRTASGTHARPKFDRYRRPIS